MRADRRDPTFLNAMKALQLIRPMAFAWDDRAEPVGPRAGEVLVGVRRIGICGTDVSAWLGRMPFVEFPRVLGHELAVEVVALGDGVSGLSIGDRCAVEPYLNCGRCATCRRGFSNCCENNRVLGVHCDGGMLPRLLLPAGKLHRSDRVSLDALALVEMLAVGRRAVARGAPSAGETVLVIGAGPIGLSALAFARLAGARALCLERDPVRRRWAEARIPGVEAIPAVGSDADLEAVAAATSGALADVVIDATGSAASMSRALGFCGFRGRLVYVGIASEPLSFHHAPVLHRRELTILASRNALPSDFTEILRLLGEGRLEPEGWVTHRAALDSLPDALPAWLEPGSGLVKGMATVDAGM